MPGCRGARGTSSSTDTPVEKTCDGSGHGHVLGARERNGLPKRRPASRCRAGSSAGGTPRPPDPATPCRCSTWCRSASDPVPSTATPSPAKLCTVAHIRGLMVASVQISAGSQHRVKILRARVREASRPRRDTQPAHTLRSPDPGASVLHTTEAAVRRPAAAQRPARRDAAAQAAGAAGVLLRPAQLGRVRDRADRPGARARRPRLLHLTPWLALAVVALLVIVVASYRQTCYAYPNGGGAYAVSRGNLGARRRPGRGQRPARRLRADRRGVRGRRRRGDHVGGPRARAARGRAVPRLRRPADRGQPARGEGVRPGLRRADVRLRRDRPARCSPSPRCGWRSGRR